MTAYTESKLAHSKVHNLTRLSLPDVNSSGSIKTGLSGGSLALNLDLPDKHKLETAFEFFNLMSQQLTDAYNGLEQQVKDLTAELARAQAQHEEEVAKKEMVTNRLEGLLNILPVGVVVLDVRGRVQQCNLAAAELLGEPLLGESWLDIIQRSFAPRLDDGHEVSLKDGRRVSLATRSLDGQPGQLIVLTDMTETRALQERLSRHQRLSSLGEMVASLAHQIRTPLSAAILYGEHLTNTDLEPAQQKRFADKLNSRLSHLEQQVRDMLIFAKGDMALADRIETAQLVTGIEMAAESPLLASHSALSVNNQAENAVLQCNLEALIGAILNLINNSIQAVGQGAQIQIHLEQHEAMLEIRVCDQGPGISERVKHRVMEPFVTTKSHGTGLGLAVVQAVVRAHQGEFRLESTSAEGTQMLLTLPICAALSVNKSQESR
ncbi:MAG: PAS domain-containing protein [Pseudomonadales bacterium]|nr:PAS domain-containing protein [Pseudomonadales bacterium]